MHLNLTGFQLFLMNWINDDYFKSTFCCKCSFLLFNVIFQVTIKLHDVCFLFYNSLVHIYRTVFMTHQSEKIAHSCSKLESKTIYHSFIFLNRSSKGNTADYQWVNKKVCSRQAGCLQFNTLPTARGQSLKLYPSAQHSISKMKSTFDQQDQFSRQLPPLLL